MDLHAPSLNPSSLNASGTEAPIASGSEPAIILETVYGFLDVPRPDEDLIGRFLAETGEWALDEARFVAGVLDDGCRVLDGGAFIGTFGLGLSRFRKLDLLCCVEANPRIVPLLEANMRRNAPGRAIVTGALISGTGGEARPGHGEQGNLGAMSFAPGAVDSGIGPTPDAVVTLRSLRERHGGFDLVKLDVEGMEEEVLRDDAAHLAGGTTTLWLECNEGPAALGILELLLSWGLEVWYFAFPTHNPDNVRGSQTPIFRWAYEAGLLAAPQREPVLDPVLAAHGCLLRQVLSAEDLRDAMWRTPRWLPQDLDGADATVLAGVASHALQGLSRQDFLRCDQATREGDSATEAEGPASHDAVARLRQERAQARTALAEAERRMAALEAELPGLRDIAQEAQEAQASAASLRTELAAVQQLRELTQTGLEKAQDVAIAHLLELEDERRLRRMTEARLAQSAALALDRLREMETLRERAAEAAQASIAAAEARMAEALLERMAAEARWTDAEQARLASEAGARHLEERVRAIELTPAWRAAQHVHRFVSQHARLHGLLRKLRAVIGTSLGRRG